MEIDHSAFTCDDCENDIDYCCCDEEEEGEGE